MDKTAGHSECAKSYKCLLAKATNALQMFYIMITTEHVRENITMN